MMHRITRSVPYIKLLLRSPISQRRQMLRAFPDFVIDDLVEIIYNVVMGNAGLAKNMRRIAFKYRKQFEDITRVAKNKRLRRQVVTKQSGGFIGASIPFIASILSTLLGEVL